MAVSSLSVLICQLYSPTLLLFTSPSILSCFSLDSSPYLKLYGIKLSSSRGATILIVLELLGDGEEVPHAPWVGDISAQLYVTLDLYSQPTEAENVPCDLNNMEKSTPGLES